VRQTGNMSCWAAALESWLRVCRPAEGFDEERLVALFARYQAPGGRIELPGLRAVAARFGMATEELDGAALTPEYLSEKLRLGHLYLTYTPGLTPEIGHSVVAYGVGPVAVDLMDPFEGYITRHFAFFTGRTRAFVGWPRRGLGAT
jgi:hypothetical protein